MEDFQKMPKMQDWDTQDLLVPTSQFKFHEIKPDHTIKFFKSNDGTGDPVGILDFNGAVMKFEGNAEESAVVFFNWVAHYFDQRLKDEYQRGYEAAKKENT